MSHHILDVLALGYTYPDGTDALHEVSFRVLHGESVAVVGANGAGKSTLLIHLNGTLLPSTGKVVIGETPVSSKTVRHLRQSVGMVFANPDDQLFMPTVAEDVAFGPLNLGLPPEAVDARVERALMEVGALHLKGRPPYRLSSGEKRAVAIATVLAMDPAILVMDEPSTALDPLSRRALIDWLRGYEHSKIIATHDLDLVLEICPRTIVLADGTIEADGATEEIFADDELLRSCRLERPLSWSSHRVP